MGAFAVWDAGSVVPLHGAPGCPGGAGLRIKQTRNNNLKIIIKKNKTDKK